MDAITRDELKAEMAAHDDLPSYPFWATREVDWKGRKVLAEAPARSYPVSQTTGD